MMVTYHRSSACHKVRTASRHRVLVVGIGGDFLLVLVVRRSNGLGREIVFCDRC